MKTVSPYLGGVDTGANARKRTASRAKRPAAQRGALPLTGVVRNPRSHRNRARKAEYFGPNAIVVAPHSKLELEHALRDFADRGVGLIVIDGGDGTVRDVLTRGAAIFEERWPRILVLPKGKTNALCVDLGLPTHWPVADALDAVRAGSVTVRRPIHVEPLDAAGHRAQGFILGAGVFHPAIAAGQVAHRLGAFQSLAVGATTAFAVLSALFGIGENRWRRQFGMRILAGPEQIEVPHSGMWNGQGRYIALMSTLDRFPAGMHPFRRQPNEIGYIAVDAPTRRTMLRAARIARGGGDETTEQLGVHQGSSGEFVLELEDPFILDGEGFPPGRYKLSMGPALDFVVP